MIRKEVFLGIGGNLGDSLQIVRHAAACIRALRRVYNFKLSQLYQTAPVSDISQNDYINAVCGFETDLTVWELWDALQGIEKKIGKEKKPKNFPRIIDIDILFFGNDSYNHNDLQIPHPQWSNRLFVLMPLSDLVSTITLPTQGSDVTINLLEVDLKSLIKQFSSQEMERQCIKSL